MQTSKLTFRIINDQLGTDIFFGSFDIYHGEYIEYFSFYYLIGDFDGKFREN